jgi:MFS family permease
MMPNPTDAMNSECSETNYRWYILILATLTSAFAVAAQNMCLPVLFDEISQDLGLDLVQIGLVWGIGALAGIPAGLMGGAIGDRYGARRTLRVACLLAGLSGALRGLSVNLGTLLATVFLFGALGIVIPMNVVKACGAWFPGRQLGLASSAIATGMALGFMLSSMISATLLSPWLGGWRNVLFFYGAIAAAFTVPWFLSRPVPGGTQDSGGEASRTTLWQAMSHVIRTPGVWVLGLAMLGFSGSIESTLGYLPLHLRGLGWEAGAADSALGTFHALSMVFAVPIGLLSDRLGSRKPVLLVAALMAMTGVGLLSVVEGALVWVAVSMAGVVRDGYMGTFMTTLIETEGIGAAYAGTAMGLTMVFSGVGRLVAPPIGNSLAEIAPGLPFAFWAALAAAGVVSLSLVKRRRTPSG